MSPNPEVISQSPESETDKNPIKIIFLAALGVISAALASYFFGRFLLTADGLSFWLFILTSVFFLVLNILNVVLVKSGLKLNLIALLEVLAALAVFYPRLWPSLSPWLILGAVLFLVFLNAGALRGSRYLKNSLKANFWPAAREILPPATTGFLIFLSVVIYLNYFSWGNFSDALGQNLVNGILNSANPILAVQFSQTSFNDTVHDFFSHIAEAELKKIDLNSLKQSSGGLMPVFNTLTPAAKEQLIAKTAAELKAQAEKAVGPLNDNARVNLVVYELIKNYISRLSPGVITSLGLLLMIVIFFTLKGFVSLFYWLIILLAFIIFKFLVVIGFAYINLETRSREYVMLS